MGLKNIEEIDALNTSVRVYWSRISVVSNVAIYIYFVVNSAQSSGKHNWKCDSEDLFERKLFLVSQELFWKKACGSCFASTII